MSRCPVTRSEVKGLGFLREMERINVALSRGKELLAIVGDHLYCTVPYLMS
ncbi:AAA domain-containing protein [Chromobacterium alticapitis]|uniref:AAA domain-containing protein n=1 Tax=Chromobacterium alticapitis TaxID=2073169 RepID=UPI0011B05927